MRDYFSLDSRLMRALNKIADLIWINILTLLCCIPIITIGASLTSMHTVVLKLYRKEEGYITRGFFAAFKKNFRQATLIWLIYLAAILLLGIDIWIFYTDTLEVNDVLKGVVFIGVLVCLISLCWAFILQSRYINPIGVTMRNTLIVGVTHAPMTLLITVTGLVTLPLLLFIGIGVPVFILIGVAGPAYLQCQVYSRVFDEIEGADADTDINAESIQERDTGR